MIRSFTDTLRMLRGGAFADECADEFAQLVRRVEETGKAGRLTLVIDLKRSSGALAVASKVTCKTPEPKPDEDLFWATVEGNLSVDNPAQQRLELRPVDVPARELRDVAQG